MPNRHRGEVAAVLDGRERTLCLTLGALAELESSVRRRRPGRARVALRERKALGARHHQDHRVRAARRGRRGSDDEVAAMRTDGGAAGFAKIAAELFAPLRRRQSGEEREGENPPFRAAARWDALMAFGLGVLSLRRRRSGR